VEPSDYNDFDPNAGLKQIGVVVSTTIAGLVGVWFVGKAVDKIRARRGA
jgi:hypothetical protein